MTTQRPADAGELFRGAFIILAGLTTVGIGVELGLERHWHGFIQRIPWAAILLLAVAVMLVAAKPSPGRIQSARMLAAVVLLAGLFGTLQHVIANYDAGPLDFRYADRWATMSATSRWWAAASKSVGPSPVLAPMALTQAAVLCLLATLRHPALKRDL